MGQPSDSEDHTPSPGTETPPDNGGTPPKDPKEDMGRILLGAKGQPADSGTNEPELSDEAKKAIERAEKRAKDNQAQYTKAQQALAERERRIQELESKLGRSNDDADDKPPVDESIPELSDEARELLEETPGMKELLELNKKKPESEQLSKEDILDVLEQREREKQEALKNAERVEREREEAIKRDKEWRELMDKELDGASEVIDTPEFLDWCQANPNQLNSIRDQYEESDPQCPVEIVRTYLDTTSRVGGLRLAQQRNVSVTSGRQRPLPTYSGAPKTKTWGEAVKSVAERRAASR